MYITTKICKNLDRLQIQLSLKCIKTLCGMCTFSCVASWRDFILLCVFLYVILSNLYSFVPVILTYPEAFLIFPCVNSPQSQFVSYGKLMWWIYSHSSIRENMAILHLPVNLIYQTQLWIGFSGFLKPTSVSYHEALSSPDRSRGLWQEYPWCLESLTFQWITPW